MTHASPITPALALAHCAPDFLESFTDAERFVFPHIATLWLRPEQHVPRMMPGSGVPWRYYGNLAGRGWGKTHGFAAYINHEAEHGGLPVGTKAAIAFGAPTDERVEKVQIANLIDLAPPWFKPERYQGGLVWPNGVRADAFTALEGGRPRGGNYALTWLTEIVDWNPNTRRAFFNNLTTATRVGKAQVLWDTTSKGRNEVIRELMDNHTRDPLRYPVQRGTMFANELLAPEYLLAECDKYVEREFDEEVMGLTFAEAAGARFKQSWLDDARVSVPPRNPDLRIVSVDPALSDHGTADMFGVCVLSRADGHVYVEADRSNRYSPDQWGDIVIEEYRRGAAGAVVERNHSGDNPTFVIRAKAREQKPAIEVHVLAPAQPFPARHPGRLYVREYIGTSSKETRASGPATEAQAGRVHLVGALPELENELTSFVAGAGQRSPNRYDAFVYGVIELAGLAQVRPVPDGAAATHGAKAAQAILRERLRAIGRSARVGM